MIPKIIHYCWFGGKKKPQNVLKNIELWKKVLPDYQIIEWNESNFDVNSYEFTKEAYSKGKYAFVSDVARLHALTTKGGIYLDTDVEVVRSFDDLLNRDYFLGREYSGVIGTATIGACQGAKFITKFLGTYMTRHFVKEDGSLVTVPNVVHLTEFLKENYPDLEILDMYYFSPKHPATRVCKKKDYTYCIHHFDGTWLSEEGLEKRRQEGKRIKKREMKMKIVEIFMPWEKAKEIKNKIKNSSILLEMLHFLLMAALLEYLYRVTIGHFPNVFTEHLINVFFDVAVLITLGNLVSWFHKKAAFVIANILLFVYVIVNIGYFRVFDTFCTPSIITEASNLEGIGIFSFLKEIYRLEDLIALMIFCANLFIITRIKKNKVKARNTIVYPLFALFFLLSYQFLNPIQRSLRQHTKLTFPTYSESIGDRFHARWCFGTNMLIYEFGLIRTQLFFGLESLFQSSVTLSDEDICYINKKLLISKPAVCQKGTVFGDKNIVFVLVESLLSSSLNHEIGTERITPCMDSLLNVPGTWSNLMVRPNVSMGMSSDGQFILFSGLLPFRNSVTVKSILDKDVVGLPKLIADSLHYKTAITIPTAPSVWHQSECSTKYGFDKETSTCTESDPRWGTDKDIFKKAITIDKQLQDNYFHCVLSSSTHSTYDHLSKDVEYLDLDYPKSYSKEYCNYLSECRFFDSQLGYYIDYLKKENLWTRTVLIIIADHHAQTQFLNMKFDDVKEDETPFIIVNAKMDDIPCVKGKVNQIDIYPSLLDLLGIDSQWRGLGKSIFKPNEYKDCVTDENYLLSEKMINSNYFKNYYNK